MKPALLFLSHRIPYPPNKGDKIRSFHLLEYLARRYRVHLGTFVDDPEDWQHLSALDRWCESRMVRPLHPGRARLKSLAGLATGEPLTLPYYRDGRLSAWVHRVLEEQEVGHVLIYSSAMAQYLLGEEGWRGRVVMDLVDVDSDKWRQYAQSRSWPMSWIYRREAERLLRFERAAGAAFDATLLVSEEEAALFRRLAPEAAPRVHALRNGVDLAWFDPAVEHPSPYEGPGPHLVFTGAMDYWPNVDAVAWFVEEVMPRLRAGFPRLEFHVVGSRPTERVRELAGEPGVQVTGAVPDIRPWIAHADAAVAPMRIARGIQNKVLEAMAMARPVVVSPMGAEGIEAEAGRELLVAESGEAFAGALAGLLRDGKRAAALGRAARERVVAEYGWERTLPLLDRWFPGDEE